MAPKKTTPARVQHRLLLVVDSDAKSLAYTSGLLEQLHYDIWTARSAEEAMHMAATALPALMIVSNRLSDISSLTFIRKLKQSDRTKSVPVIVIGPEGDSLDERQCLTAGAVTYLTKPVTTEDLYRVVQVATESVPRMNIRIATNLAAIVHNRDAQNCHGMRVSALSEYGAFICSPDPCPRDSRLLIIIHLADKAVAAEANVIYNARSKGDHGERGMGVQFVQIADEDRELIRKFIRAEIKKHTEQK